MLKGVYLVKKATILLGIAATVLMVGCEKEPRIPVERKPATKQIKKERDQPSPVESARYAYNIVKQQTPKQMKTGSEERILIRIRNTSNRVWEKEGAIRVGYYWTNEEGERIQGQEGRMLIRKNDIPSNEILAVRPKVSAPEKPGDYYLVWDMIEEGVGWFGSKGAKPVRVPVTVQ